MVCRSTPGNSAVTTIARNASNLHDVQVLSLFHEIRSEAPRAAAAPTENERDEFLNDRITHVRQTLTDLPERRRRDLINRLHEADSVSVDGRTYYAWRNIEQRSVFAREAMNAHFADIARHHNLTPEEVEAAFNRMMRRDWRVNGEEPQAPQNVRFSIANLPQDRRTRHALAMLHTGGPNVSSDPSYASLVYARTFEDSVRIINEQQNNPANQCPDCGQFAAADHTCSPNTDAPHDHGVSPRNTEPTEESAAGSSNRTNGAGEHQTLPPEQQIVRVARQSVRMTEDGRRWVTPEGRVYEGRDVAVQAAAVDALDRELRNAIDGELGSEGASADFIEAAHSSEFMRMHGRQFETFDGHRFSRFEDAALNAFYLQRDSNGIERCPECEQFMGQDHACNLEPAQPVPTPVSTAEPAAQPGRQRTPMRNYRSENGDSIRMMNLSAVRLGIAAGETFMLDDLNVTIAHTTDNSDATDNIDATRYTLTGSIAVHNTGQRRTRTRDRFTVDARTLRCTCPDYRATYDCRHLRQAAENIQALINDRDAVAVAPAAAMETVASDLRDEYDASLASSQAARTEFAATTEVAYTEDMTAFQTAWDEAKAHFETGDHRLPYMYENATNGLGARNGGRSIGIEIEVDFPDDMDYTAKQRVAREIYEAGLSDSPEVRPWHWRARAVDTRGRSMGGGYTDDPNKWSVEFDRSVDDVGGQRGCEIVSPILYDTPETWRNLKTVCDIVERHGGRVTPRTGLHINIGAADFDHTVGNHNRLIGLANAYEDVIVRASHNPQSGPQHRGRDYCRPMTMPEEGFTSIRQAQRSIDPQNYEGSSHRAMINLDHVPAEGAPVRNSTRVEVRIFDGTIDPGRIQANVKMSLGLVNAAVRGAEVPRDHERAGSHRAANVGSNGRMRRLSGTAWEADTASFRRFADTLFSREEDKKQLTYAFAASRWQRR